MDGVSEYDFTTATGLDCLDYLNGQIIPLDNGSKQLYTGISNGRIVQIIGKSGTGKTTLAVDIAMNIVKRYERGLLYFYDFEQDNTEERIRSLAGCSQEYFKKHVAVFRDGISTESLLTMLSKIKEFKMKYEKELLVPNENGVKDASGEIIKVLTPTVVIADSLAMMLPKDILDEETVGGSMAATSIAKVNTAFFKRAVQILNQANIILIFVNHITQQISIGITPPSSIVNYLKQDESLPGGKGHIYVTDTLIKLTAGAKLEEDKKYGIKGFEVKAELCKSRHAPAGRSINLIYDQVRGFRDDLSKLGYLNTNGMLKGNGMAYYIDGYDKVKFKMSNFIDKLKENPEFKDYFESTSKAVLYSSIKESFIPELNTSKEEENIDTNN